VPAVSLQTLRTRRTIPALPLVSGPTDATLLLTLKDAQSIYREGEIIPLKLHSPVARRRSIVLDTRNYDRSGRLNAESFCLAPDGGRDPLADYYSSGLFGFIGGVSAVNTCSTRRPTSLTWN